MNTLQQKFKKNPPNPPPPPPNLFQQKKICDIKINELIYHRIKEGLRNKTPLMMGRYGSTECQAMRSVLLYRNGIQDYISHSYDELCIYSGFFQNHNQHPTKKQKERYLIDFFNIMIEATQNCDVLGTWNGSIGFEEFFVKEYAKPEIILTNIGFFGPNIHEDLPYTYALKDQKVLVIHPFASTIYSQYKRYDKLFVNNKVLPNFHLQVFQAVQTLHQERDDRFSDWFEALDWMSLEISKLNFDIALLGCGAYGFPLASRIKNMGKIAIHCGGILQLLFGIKGKRWEIEQSCVGNELFNPYWVYPNNKETIKDSSKIEGGCYW